jgi:hypothetical protein
MLRPDFSSTAAPYHRDTASTAVKLSSPQQRHGPMSPSRLRENRGHVVIGLRLPGPQPALGQMEVSGIRRHFARFTHDVLIVYQCANHCLRHCRATSIGQRDRVVGCVAAWNVPLSIQPAPACCP